MESRAQTVGHDAALIAHLQAELEAAKADSVLAPVTVVVPSNLVGLSLRRALGRRGLANVSFVTPFRLAGLLAADRLGSSVPITNPVLLAAVRAELAHDTSRFGEASHHHATHTAVARLFADLSSLSAAERTTVRDTGRAGTRAVALHDAIRRRLGDVHVEADLIDAAVDRPDLAAALRSFGPILWLEPAPVTGPARRLATALAEATDLTRLRLATGEPTLDGSTTPHATDDDGPTGPTPPLATTVASMSDADDEVRWVVRRILALAEAGTPLERIAVFHPVADPYLGLLTSHLAAAGLPHNGPARQRLADSTSARTLLAALELPAQRWGREAVMAVAAGAPLVLGGTRARPSAWDDVSRRAGIVRGLDSWPTRLNGHNWKRDHEREHAETLATFVTQLAELVGAVTSAATWADRGARTLELLDGLLGPSHRHSGWPEPEQDAFDRVADAVVRISSLDELDPEPSMPTFLTALRAELDAPGPRVGRFGEGVRIGPITGAVGADLDAVFIVGAVEGLLPAGRTESSLLPDSALDGLTGSGLGSAERRATQHRAVLHALATAPPEGRTITVPRGDLRGGRGTTISRWALPSVAALVGRPVVATDWDELTTGDPIDGIVTVASHERGLLDATTHATLADRDLVDLAPVRSVDLPAHPVAEAVPGLARGLVAKVARRSAEFTEWDGNLAGEPIPRTTVKPISPSRLEAWAACGYRYYLANVLGLRDRDEPERVVELSPLDKGSAIHEVLERFVLEAIEHGPPAPTTPWTDEQHARLIEIAHEVFAELEVAGKTGRALPWRQLRSELLASLEEFLEHDNRMRAGEGATPEHVEFEFGFDDDRLVGVELPDGRHVHFRGYIDRVDVTSSGETLVADYKSGRGAKYEVFSKRDADDADPTLEGQTLQLGVYAEAAAALLGRPVRSSHYWMVEARAQYKRHGYLWTDERRARFVEVVAGIVDGIEGGVFPATPGGWNSWRGRHEACGSCDFDSICDRDRGEYEVAKADAPELGVRVVLTEPGGAA